MATREQVMAALQTLLTGAYSFSGGVTRRNQSPETIATPGNPALVLLTHHESYERQSPSLPYRRVMTVLAIVYIDVGTDPNAIPDTYLNNAQDAIDAVMKPDNPVVGRNTLGGLVYSAMIKDQVTRAPGDRTGKGLAIIPIEIILP